MHSGHGMSPHAYSVYSAKPSRATQIRKPTRKLMRYDQCKGFMAACCVAESRHYPLAGPLSASVVQKEKPRQVARPGLFIWTSGRPYAGGLLGVGGHGRLRTIHQLDVRHRRVVARTEAAL